MLRRKTAFILYLALGICTTACKKETRIEKITDEGYYTRLANIINDNSGLSNFNSFLQTVQGNVPDTLLLAGPYTVIAPDNPAFFILYSSNGYDTIGVHRNSLSAPYFVLNGDISLKQLPIGTNQEFTTISGQKVWVSKWRNGNDTVTGVNGTRVNTADVPGSNGRINVVNRTYMKYSGDNCVMGVNSVYNLSFFAAALQRCHYDDSLKTGGPYTVLAPDNTAFVNRGFATMDSVLRTDPAVLKDLVKGHILTQRKFLLDMEMDRTTNDTMRYTNVAGDIVRAVLIPDTRFPTSDPRAKRILFVGSKESYAAPTRFDVYNTTYPCGNGTVIMIEKVLKQ